MTSRDNSIAIAESRFDKIQRQASEGAQAMAQHKAESARVRENMARLRALRETAEAAAQTDAVVKTTASRAGALKAGAAKSKAAGAKTAPAKPRKAKAQLA